MAFPGRSLGLRSWAFSSGGPLCLWCCFDELSYTIRLSFKRLTCWSSRIWLSAARHKEIVEKMNLLHLHSILNPTPSSLLWEEGLERGLIFKRWAWERCFRVWPPGQHMSRVGHTDASDVVLLVIVSVFVVRDPPLLVRALRMLVLLVSRAVHLPLSLVVPRRLTVWLGL